MNNELVLMYNNATASNALKGKKSPSSLSKKRPKTAANREHQWSGLKGRQSTNKILLEGNRSPNPHTNKLVESAAFKKGLQPLMTPISLNSKTPLI
jgi:hypothetical protein